MTGRASENYVIRAIAQTRTDQPALRGATTMLDSSGTYDSGLRFFLCHTTRFRSCGFEFNFHFFRSTTLQAGLYGVSVARNTIGISPPFTFFRLLISFSHTRIDVAIIAKGLFSTKFTTRSLWILANTSGTSIILLPKARLKHCRNQLFFLSDIALSLSSTQKIRNRL